MKLSITFGYKVAILIFSVVIGWSLYHTSQRALSGDLPFAGISILFLLLILFGVMYLFASVTVSDDSISVQRLGIRVTVNLKDISKVRKIVTRLGDCRYEFFDRSGRCKISYIDYFNSGYLLEDLLNRSGISLETKHV